MLARITTYPDEVAAPFRLTRQESVPELLKDCVVHVKPLRTGTPDPLVLMIRFPVDELLAIVTTPVKELV